MKHIACDSYKYVLLTSKIILWEVVLNLNDAKNSQLQSQYANKRGEQDLQNKSLRSSTGAAPR